MTPLSTTVSEAVQDEAVHTITSEAIARREAGLETLAEITRSSNVRAATISRLRA
jgi:hypothetical protein